ncbi:MAG: heterodisulfide reductase subunit C [Desulfitibacter sp. BRH_c19]|nr:MAG: heterodisulfide reductase subunit C [Desulfitibacter sp. BRH_c19]
MLEEFDISYQLNDSAPIKKQIEELSGEQVKKCYQCGKCTAGCPVAFAMDNPPRKILRLLQVGLAEEALESKSVWICATCETCYARCPRGVDIPRVMEAVRILAKKKGIVPEKNINYFNDLFLKSVKSNGRVHEMGLIVMYNLMSMQPFKDATLAPKLFLDGKISPFPHKVKNPLEIQRLFERVREKEEGGHI